MSRSPCQRGGGRALATPREACYTLVMQAAACAFHSEREALGVCVSCRARVCAECTTKVDGINHCVRCLAQRALQDAAPVASATTASPRVAVMTAVLWCGVFWLALWGLLEVVFPEAA